MASDVDKIKLVDEIYRRAQASSKISPEVMTRLTNVRANIYKDFTDKRVLGMNFAMPKVEPPGNIPSKSLFPTPEEVLARDKSRYDPEHPVTSGLYATPTQQKEAVAVAASMIPFHEQIPIVGDFVKKNVGDDEALQAAQFVFQLGSSAIGGLGAGKALASIPKVANLLKNSGTAARILSNAGLNVTEGAIQELLFSAQTGKLPTAKEAALFTAMDAAIPALSGSGEMYRASRQWVKNKLAQKGGRKALEEAGVIAKDISKTAKEATKTRIGRANLAQSKGLDELRKAKEELGKLGRRKGRIFTKEGKDVTERAQAIEDAISQRSQVIEEQLAKAERLRKSPQGAEKLRKQLIAKDRNRTIRNLQKVLEKERNPDKRATIQALIDQQKAYRRKEAGFALTPRQEKALTGRPEVTPVTTEVTKVTDKPVQKVAQKEKFPPEGYITPDEALKQKVITKKQHEKITHGGLSKKQYDKMISIAQKDNTKYRKMKALIAQYEKSGRTATYYHQKQKISVDGKLMSIDDAVKKMEGVVEKPKTKFVPTGVKGEKPQGVMNLGVQATVPKGKIKTTEPVPKKGLFATPKSKGKQLKIEDPVDEVIAVGVRHPGKLTEEMRQLQKKYPKLFRHDKGLRTLDEWASDKGMTQDRLAQQLLSGESTTARARRYADEEKLFYENKKAVETTKGGGETPVKAVMKGDKLFLGDKELFGSMVGIGVDEEGNPTYDPVLGGAGLVGMRLWRSKKFKHVRDTFVEKIQNSQLKVRQLQELKESKLIGKGLDPHEAEIRYHGRKDKRLREVINIVTKIDDDIVKYEKALPDDVNLTDEVNKYLIAKHAPYYNRVHGDGATGITTENARRLQASIESSPHAAQVKDIAQKIKRLNQQTLKILHNGQVIDDKTYKKLTEVYPEHIPLQRIMDEMDDSKLVQVLSGGKGISVFGSGLKRGKGSEREIADIITNVTASVLQAVERAEKNMVGLSTLQFARNNKHLGLFKELRLGVDVKPIAVDAKTGQAVFDTKSLFRDKDIIGVRENGKQVFLRVSDPSLANALKMLGREELGTATSMVNVFTKYVTQTATRFNPAFQIPNLIRDIQEMVVYLAAQKEYGFRGTLSASKKIPQSMADIADALFGSGKSEGAKLYRQMELDGGTTGGLALSTRGKLEIDIAKIRKTNRSNPRKVQRALVNFFDNYNAVFEDATRLSVYKEALNRGLTRQQAAVFAKEATINFNRKGVLGTKLNSWYAFANAAVQGSAKIYRAMKNPKVLGAVSSSVFTGVVAQNLWNDMIDPEWRDKVPEWERNNNLVILYPGAKEGRFERFIIPGSWGIKPIKVAADYMVDIFQGYDRGTKKDIVAGIAGSALDALNPLGGSDIIQTLTPTIVDVPMDIARNKAWFGKEIYPESKYYPNLPDHKKYFRSLRDTASGLFAINTAQYLNDASGISISPQSMKYALEQYAGGTGRFTLRTYNTAVNIGKGKLSDVNEIPVVNRFFKTTPPDIIQRWEDLRKINDPSYKRLQEESDTIKWERNITVWDAMDQFKSEKTREGRRQILIDVANKDPKAYKSLTKRIRDDAKGISRFDSQLSEMEPEIRAKIVIEQIDRTDDKRERMKELYKAGVLNTETLAILKQKGFEMP